MTLAHAGLTRRKQSLDFEAIRRRHALVTVASASLKLSRAGSEWKGCCPFHPDRSPSFTIFADGNRFHCFGCGASGDVLDFVRKLHGVDLRKAAALLSSNQLAAEVHAFSVPEPKTDTTAAAQRIWRAASPIADTPAAAYLRGRGIHIRLPDCLRFAPLRYPGSANLLPCLVAAVTSGDDTIAGIQRTFVREDGSGKADVPIPKLSLGRIAGGAIRLAPATADLFITGGLEDGLTVQQELGPAVWASTGEGNIAAAILPSGVRTVTIGADRDAGGDLHARRAAEAFAFQGRSVRIIRPTPGFKDFNAELMGVRA